MIEQVSLQIINFLVKKGAINTEEDSIAFYKYGVEITLSSLINILLIIVLSLLLKSILDGLIFLLIFIPIRQYTGGYHADSYFKCNLVFSIAFLSTYVTSNTIGIILPLWTSIVLLILELLFIIIYCPVANKNKPINNPKQRTRHKLISLIIFCVSGVCGLIATSICIKHGTMILFTLHLIVVLWRYV